MEQVQFTVHGEEAWTIPRAIRGYPEEKRADYEGDGFAVIVTESYYFRGGAYLVVIAIFELIEEHSVKVTFISGGGAYKVHQHVTKVESTELNRVVGKIEDYCRENGLEIEGG